MLVVVFVVLLMIGCISRNVDWRCWEWSGFEAAWRTCLVRCPFFGLMKVGSTLGTQPWSVVDKEDAFGETKDCAAVLHSEGLSFQFWFSSEALSKFFTSPEGNSHCDGLPRLSHGHYLRESRHQFPFRMFTLMIVHNCRCQSCPMY